MRLAYDALSAKLRIGFRDVMTWSVSFRGLFGYLRALREAPGGISVVAN